MRFLFVVNRSAGRVNEPALRARLEREFRGHEFSIAHETPSRPALASAGPDLFVVAVGGDGTVQRILRRVGTPFPCPLGILPLGTANDLAGAAGIPSDFAEACAVLRRGSIRRIDLMEVNGIPFATAGGLGLPAWVAKRADRLRAGRLVGRLARRCGRGVYAIAALWELLGRRRLLFGRIENAGWGRRWAAILVSNQPLLGGFRPSPGADARDGRLDLCAIEAPRGRARLAWLVGRIRRGDVACCRETRTERARAITVVTRRPTEFLGDGEVLCCGTRFEVRVSAAALPLVGPEPTDPVFARVRRRSAAPHPPPHSAVRFRRHAPRLEARPEDSTSRQATSTPRLDDRPHTSA
jgi:diacylglycerol kinase family enzyme